MPHHQLHRIAWKSLNLCNAAKLDAQVHQGDALKNVSNWKLALYVVFDVWIGCVASGSSPPPGQCLEKDVKTLCTSNAAKHTLKLDPPGIASHYTQRQYFERCVNTWFDLVPILKNEPCWKLRNIISSVMIPSKRSNALREKRIGDSVNGEWLWDDRDEEKIGTGYNLIDC